MVNVGINIPYIGSYKLRLWVFTSFSVDLICIATFFYTSTGGARWEYHSAAWLNHESNHLFSGHDPIRSRDLCFYSEYMIPWIFTSCCQSCPKKKRQRNTCNLSVMKWSKVDGSTNLMPQENFGTIEMLKLGPRWHIFFYEVTGNIHLQTNHI